MIPSTCHLQIESKHFSPVLFEKRGGLAVLLHRRVGLLPQLGPLVCHEINFSRNGIFSHHTSSEILWWLCEFVVVYRVGIEFYPYHPWTLKTF